MEPMLNIAVGAARAAGNIIIRHIDRVDSLSIRDKRRNDFVSEVDHLAENEIIRHIRKAHPNHSILGEEGGHREGKAQGNDTKINDWQWIVDPLDGTTNFLRGLPHYSVSIGVRHQGRVELGVIYDPFKEELFCAVRGRGATLNSRRIRVSQKTGLEGALLGTGIPVRSQMSLNQYMITLRALVIDTAGLRRAGSAALDLAYVAAGRLDGFWEFGLRPWDITAGVLIVQEAGGLVGDMEGGHDFWESGDIVAATPKVFKAMVKRLRPCLSR